MENTLYSSPRGHIANKVLWFKKENEYYKSRIRKFNYVEVAGLI